MADAGPSRLASHRRPSHPYPAPSPPASIRSMASHEAKGATAPSSNDSLTAAAADGPRPLSRSGAASPDEADSLGRKDLSDSEGHAGAPVGESQAEYRAHLASQPVGVSKIEALYRVFGNSKAAVWTLYAAISGEHVCDAAAQP